MLITTADKIPENTGLDISSEIGRLESVVVHTPGRELERVTPRNFGRMLMEDILPLQETQREHQLLIQVLEKAEVKVHQFSTLLYDTLASLPPRELTQFIDSICQLEGYSAEQMARMHQLTVEGLTEVCIEGELQEMSLSRFLRQHLYAVPPIPNLMFVRDLGAIVNRGVILSSMAHSERARESLLFEVIFRQHPILRETTMQTHLWLGDNPERRQKYLKLRGSAGISHLTVEGARLRIKGRKNLQVGSKEYSEHDAMIYSDDAVLEADDLKISVGKHFVLEAGNIFILSRNTLLIGCNERSSASAIDALAREMLRNRSLIRTVLVVVFAQDKEFYNHHLDTGFSILNFDGRRLECLVHAPIVEKHGASITVAKMSFAQGSIQVEACASLREALENLNPHPPTRVEFIVCGGEKRDSVRDRVMQEREWHHQAVNVLPLAPGKLIAFDRNQRTLEVLKQVGYKIIEAEEFLSNDFPNLDSGKGNEATRMKRWLDNSNRTVITLPAKELPRAHGGPRSLVLPLRRAPLRVELEGF